MLQHAASVCFVYVSTKSNGLLEFYFFFHMNEGNGINNMFIVLSRYWQISLNLLSPLLRDSLFCAAGALLTHFDVWSNKVHEQNNGGIHAESIHCITPKYFDDICLFAFIANLVKIIDKSHILRWYSEIIDIPFLVHVLYIKSIRFHCFLLNT